MTDTDDIASRLRSAAELATPGPWVDVVTPYAKGDPSNGPVYDVQVKAAGGERVAHLSDDADSVDGANAAYIALANPENVLALLDERDKLRDAVTNLLGLIDEYAIEEAFPSIVAEARAALGTTEGADSERASNTR